MGGLFGVVSQSDCVEDLFYGTDYHSHLGTCRGGMAVKNGPGFVRHIHDITSAQFRSKFAPDLKEMKGSSGIGVISDFDSQPLLISSHLGNFAIVTVGVIQNAEELAKQACDRHAVHFCEMSGGGVNPTELVASLIAQGSRFEEGIRLAQETIVGSCSMLLLTDDGIYAARDRLGRTPVILGKKEGAWAAAIETCAFANLGYEYVRDLGPGEIVLITPEGCQQKCPPGDHMQICAFLWVYYGFPASNYEGVNTEIVRNRCGEMLARKDNVTADLVAGIPDSGTGHAIGYANASGLPYGRPFVKYTPTWPRSFMPQDQEVRTLVAKMKLIPIPEMIQGKRLLFCEDSIVRGTQLCDTIRQFYDLGAREVHMRPACPPLLFGCKFLNFSRSRSEMDLAARRAVKELEGDAETDFREYATPGTEKQAAMIDRIRQRLSLTTLHYQELDDLIEAIGLPREKICTFCWSGCEGCK